MIPNTGTKHSTRAEVTKPNDETYFERVHGNNEGELADNLYSEITRYEAPENIGDYAEHVPGQNDFSGS
jgi:hypothetical protein